MSQKTYSVPQTRFEGWLNPRISTFALLQLGGGKSQCQLASTGTPGQSSGTSVATQTGGVPGRLNKEAQRKLPQSAVVVQGGAQNAV